MFNCVRNVFYLFWVLSLFELFHCTFFSNKKVNVYFNRLEILKIVCISFAEMGKLVVISKPYASF